MIIKMKDEIKLWTDSDWIDEETKLILSNSSNESLKEMFTKQIPFGTGGMRGLMGPGTNRINALTIARATAGFADYLIGEYTLNRKIVIGYDNRKYSKKFAEIAAEILSAKGMTAYLFDKLTATPIVSYAIRKLGCVGGIMITASHNPKEYNGYKIYDSTGCQVLPDKIDCISQYISNYNNCFILEKDEQNVIVLANEIVNQYVDEFSTYIDQKEKIISIGYSAQHGTGAIPITKLLNKYGFNNVSYVMEQMDSDPNFSNTKSPNPEDDVSFEMLKRYGMKENLDLLLTNDPDADRLGVCYQRKDGTFNKLTGNQVGAILCQYLTENKNIDSEKNNQNYIVKTIVTSELGAEIVKANGIRCINVLTGFKYIGDKINELGANNFVLAYEESYGYLVNPIVRDKDGLQMVLIISEIANVLKEQGMTLGDYLTRIYEKYGYYAEELINIDFSKFTSAQIENIQNEIVSVFSLKAKIIEDYGNGKRYDKETDKVTALDLPKENVFKLHLKEDTWICIRSSGTEPKMKVYLGTRADNGSLAEKKINQIKDEIAQIINASLLYDTGGKNV